MELYASRRCLSGFFFEGCLQDCVTVTMKYNHNIPVSTAQSEGETVVCHPSKA